MAKSTSVISQKKKKKPGPARTGKGTPVLVRLHEPMLSALDDWRQSDASRPSRPEAIRRLVEKALHK
jgi:hypothetical protein